MARIIVVEDNPQTTRMVVKLLSRAGHTVETALTGEEGLIKILGNTPDLLLIDFGLPDIDGQTIVSLIRQTPELVGTPVIAFTAWPPDSAHKMAQAYKCDGVILKPINTRAFARAVEAFLRPVAAPQ
jgi:DNA-binding response OmpR family regulator